jgi:hypothetical protein
MPNYKECKFSSEEKLRNHIKTSKNCPVKNIIVNEEEDDTNVLVINISEVEWGPYAQGITIDEDDYVDYQDIMKTQHKIHCKGGKPLWFRESETAAISILEHILDPNTQVISLLAEPGSGKTAVMHNLIYQILLLPHHKAIDQKCITITTGMSDTDWFDQIMDVFKLKDGKYLWESLNKVDINSCISHRSNFHKRITWILENLQYISNHVFIIDENHIADEKDMTIDSEFRRLGLTDEKMKEYNIKIIIVSATPDVTLSVLSRNANHKKVILENGVGYKGFVYYTNEGLLSDYHDKIEIETLIRGNFSTPRYHYIRARTHIEKGEYRESILAICKKNNWITIEDDSDHNYYLSFKLDENETKAGKCGKLIIQTYIQPTHHTFILIKNKYPASKRLKITQYTGLIIEKPAKAMNTTVTCNGLIPRFWGYDPLPEFPHGQKPLFICNKNSVDEYIKFKMDFVYNEKSYTGTKIKSDENKTKELAATWPCIMIGSEAMTHSNNIGIYGVGNDEPKYFNSVGEIAPFLRSKGFEGVKDVNEFSTGPNGYKYPRRSTEHNSEDNRIIYEDYKNRYVKNGGGSHINGKWQKDPNAGQPYMIWPVYDFIDSDPNDVKYYVHYLILKPQAETDSDE